MDPVAKKQANLRVLQRQDRAIVDILDAASHVVVYRFDDDTEAWNKFNVEGTMFVVRANVPPVYRLFVLNRASLDNFVVGLSPDLAIDVTADFVIYKSGDDNTFGLWISEAKDRNRIGSLITDLCQQIGNAAPTAPKSTVNAGLDLLSLLKRAKEEHDLSGPISPRGGEERYIFGLPPPGPIPGIGLTPLAPSPLAAIAAQQSGQIPAISQPVMPPMGIPGLGGPMPGAANPMSLPPYGPPPIPGASGAYPLPQNLPPFAQPPWTPGVPLRSLGDWFAWLEALPPAAPRGSLSKLELQGRAVHLLTQGTTFLNSLYDSYLLTTKQ